MKKIFVWEYTLWMKSVTGVMNWRIFYSNGLTVFVRTFYEMYNYIDLKAEMHPNTRSRGWQRSQILLEVPNKVPSYWMQRQKPVALTSQWQRWSLINTKTASTRFEESWPFLLTAWLPRGFSCCVVSSKSMQRFTLVAFSTLHNTSICNYLRMMTWRASYMDTGISIDQSNISTNRIKLYHKTFFLLTYSKVWPKYIIGTMRQPKNTNRMCSREFRGREFLQHIKWIAIPRMVALFAWLKPGFIFLLFNIEVCHN